MFTVESGIRLSKTVVHILQVMPVLLGDFAKSKGRSKELRFRFQNVHAVGERSSFYIPQQLGMACS